MDADQIVKLTPGVVRELLEPALEGPSDAQSGPETRSAARWPFPGTVEVWLPEGTYGEKHALATMHNLSLDGLAMRIRRPIPAGIELKFAMHQPEMSVYGCAIVRHCTQAPMGYLVGCEFVFGRDDEEYPGA